MNEKLTLTEGIRLADLEKEITRHKESFVKCGLALEEIRDNKLYRKNHATFEDYCQKRWGFSRQYAAEFIKGAVAVKELPKHLSTKVDNAGQAIALSKIDKDKRVEVLKIAASKGTVTAKAISHEAKNQSSVSAKPAGASAGKFTPPAAVFDGTDCPVPVDLLGLWNRREEVKDWMAMLSEVKCGIEKAKADGDLLYVEIRDSLIADLKMAREAVSYALPYAVCPTCSGQLVGKCTFCKGRGLVSKQLYEKADKKVRDMREKFGQKKGKI